MVRDSQNPLLGKYFCTQNMLSWKFYPDEHTHKTKCLLFDEFTGQSVDISDDHFSSKVVAHI